jgi:hypothetical protein
MVVGIFEKFIRWSPSTRGGSVTGRDSLFSAGLFLCCAELPGRAGFAGFALFGPRGDLEARAARASFTFAIAHRP